MRYFIQLSFKGTNYHGWQYQPNALSVQELIDKALSTVLKDKTRVTGAGRTDSGVHASYFIAHFDTVNTEIPIDSNFIYKLNGILPKDIAIIDISPVTEDAHARFDALNRTYHYYIHQKKNPFLNDRSFFLPQKLDIDLMNVAAQLLLNFTDFTSFSKLHTDVKTNNCKVMNASWEIHDYQLTFTITADRFLRNMVRAIVGTLIDVGKNKISTDDFIGIIEEKDRSNAGTSAPAHGLFLSNIIYPGSIFLKN